VSTHRTADLGFARLDLDRARRTGTPEVVYAAGKSPEQTVACLAALRDGGSALAWATRVDDVGVAGVHRVLAVAPDIADADVVVVVAGMDGALPSVVAGLTDRLVVAVPTSVGYGAAFEGLAALLTMLTACAPGVLVVNIDNGFGAGVAAARIARSAQR
jgi:pyridinium-3,5-biscarboxylic acid mononucleotide synthase